MRQLTVLITKARLVKAKSRTPSLSTPILSLRYPLMYPPKIAPNPLLMCKRPILKLDFKGLGRKFPKLVAINAVKKPSKMTAKIKYFIFG